MNQKATAPAAAQQLVETIQTHNDFVAFVNALRHDLKTGVGEWENDTLPAYLEALAAWVQDMDGYFENRGEMPPQQPTWKTLGQILLAARTYE